MKLVIKLVIVFKEVHKLHAPYFCLGHSHLYLHSSLEFFRLLILNFLKHEFLGFSLSEKFSARRIYLLYQSVNQVKYIYDDIGSHQIHEIKGEVVPGFWIAHEQAVVEHEPYTDQDNALVDNLDHV